MPTERAPSVLASWTRTIVDALKAEGIDPAEVLESAGIESDAFRDPNGRLPITAMARLWRKAAERVGDPAFGLKVSKYVRHTTFHALGYSVLASSSVQEAAERLVRYYRVVSDVASLELTREGNRARLLVVLKPGYQSGGQEAMDAVLSLLTRAFRILAGREFPLESVELRRVRPSDVTPYERFFRCAVSFDNAVDALTFDAGLLEQRLPAGNPELARFSDAAVREYLARMETGTLADRVRGAIAEQMGTKLSPDDVARKLGLSLRSMQRGLKEEHGTSYEDLLREIRKELACAYLKEGRYSVTEIAFLLGYENLGAFARAFRRWTGVSPSDYAQGK